MQKEKEAKDSKLKILIKLTIFLLIGLIILQIITPIFIPKWVDKYGGMTQKIKGIYTEEKDTIDAIILGNSDANKGISTMKLWKDHGITSYNLGTPMQTSWTSYYLLKEMYKYQNPKLVIFEADCLFEEKDRSQTQVRKVVDNMKFSMNKLEMIFSPAYKNSIARIGTYLFPISRYHSRWNEIDINEVKTSYLKYYDELGGYEIAKKVKPYKHKTKYLTKNNKNIKNIPEKSSKYFDKILELCKKNGTQVILIELPSAT